MAEKKAVIFDMDGVILDNEGFWAQAEAEVFGSLGVALNDALCKLTRTMTTTEAVQFWFDRYPWENISLTDTAKRVVNRVIELIQTEDCTIDNIRPFIENLRSTGYKIGLATNSPGYFIPICLERAGVADLFDAVSSAEDELQGKPDPAVYLTTAKKLGVPPQNCIVIEDSYHGMMAAKKAGMTVLAFTNNNDELRFDIADRVLQNYSENNWWWKNQAQGL